MEVKIKVNTLYTKYAWRWKIPEETCLICQQEFTTHCHKCPHPIKCAPCIGTCTHIFHLHCVEEWVQNNKNCPTCRSVWEFKKILKYDEKSPM